MEKNSILLILKTNHNCIDYCFIRIKKAHAEIDELDKFMDEEEKRIKAFILFSPKWLGSLAKMGNLLKQSSYYLAITTRLIEENATYIKQLENLV